MIATSKVMHSRVMREESVLADFLRDLGLTEEGTYPCQNLNREDSTQRWREWMRAGGDPCRTGRLEGLMQTTLRRFCSHDQWRLEFDWTDPTETDWADTLVLTILPLIVSLLQRCQLGGRAGGVMLSLKIRTTGYDRFHAVLLCFNLRDGVVDVFDPWGYGDSALAAPLARALLAWLPPGPLARPEDPAERAWRLAPVGVSCDLQNTVFEPWVNNHADDACGVEGTCYLVCCLVALCVARLDWYMPSRIACRIQTLCLRRIGELQGGVPGGERGEPRPWGELRWRLFCLVQTLSHDADLLREALCEGRHLKICGSRCPEGGEDAAGDDLFCQQPLTECTAHWPVGGCAWFPAERNKRARWGLADLEPRGVDNHDVLPGLLAALRLALAARPDGARALRTYFVCNAFSGLAPTPTPCVHYIQADGGHWNADWVGRLMDGEGIAGTQAGILVDLHRLNLGRDDIQQWFQNASAPLLLLALARGDHLLQLRGPDAPATLTKLLAWWWARGPDANLEVSLRDLPEQPSQTQLEDWLAAWAPPPPSAGRKLRVRLHLHLHLHPDQSADTLQARHPESREFGLELVPNTGEEDPWWTGGSEPNLWDW